MNDKFTTFYGKTQLTSMAANLEQEMVNQNIDLTLKKGKHAPVKQTTVLSNLFGNFNATKNLDHNNAAHGFESTISP